MPLFTDAQLQKFADLFEDLGMMDDAIIERSVVTNTPYGQKEELVVIGESKCLVGDPLSKSSSALLQNYADRLGSLGIWPLYMPLGIDVQIGDILTIKDQRMKVQIALAPKSFAVSSNFIASEVVPS